MNVPVPNANIALWIAVARTSGSSESRRLSSLRSRPASAVTGCVPYVGSCANFIEHGTGPRLRSRQVIRPLLRVRLSEQVGVVDRCDLGVRAQPALERVVAEAAVQDVMRGLADSGGLLGVLARQWHCVEGRVQPGSPEKADRVARPSWRAGQDPV